MTKRIFNLRNVIAIAICLAGVTMFSSCDKDNPSKVTAKFRFSGTPVGVKTKSAASATPMFRASSALSGEEDFTNFYTMLGAKKGAFTPTEMKISISQLYIGRINENLGGYTILDFSSGEPVVVDLAKPVIIAPTEIEQGFYDFISFAFAGALTGSVSFPKPVGFDLENHAYNRSIYFKDETVLFKYPNNITVTLDWLQPASVDYYYGALTGGEPSAHLESKVGGVYDMFFFGDKYIMVPTSERAGKDLSLEDYWPGCNWGIGLNSPFTNSLIVPFEGINIPETAKSVRFEIVWDIENIIEWYEGPTNSTNDDIFVLRDRFWEGFSLRAIIE